MITIEKMEKDDSDKEVEDASETLGARNLLEPPEEEEEHEENRR